MKIIELKGVIEWEDNDDSRIWLKDGSDFPLDLVDAFIKAVEENGNMVQVNYWISNKPCTKNEMLEGWLKKISGAIDAEYDEYWTGSITYGATSWDTTQYKGRLEVGGHDLFMELAGQEGKFIILELNFKSA